jgi:hypothetical protein
MEERREAGEEVIILAVAVRLSLTTPYESFSAIRNINQHCLTRPTNS